MRITLKEVKKKEGYASGVSFIKGTRAFETIRYFFIWLFLNLGFTANQVTIGFGILSVIGLIFIAIGNYWLMVFGCFLEFFAVFLDDCDGAVARIRKHTSNLGMFIDGFIHSIHYSFLWVALGAGIWKLGWSINYLYLGMFTTFIWISNTFLKDTLYKAFFDAPKKIKDQIIKGKKAYEGDSFFKKDKRNLKEKIEFNLFKIIKMNASLFILVILAIFGYERYFLIFYSMLVPIFFIRNIYMISVLSKKNL